MTSVSVKTGRSAFALEPRISVVIPAFNREQTVGRAIESVLAQTRPPAQILLVDDGSTDGTAASIARYSDRVEYVCQPNAGASAARNDGVERATSAWVAFLDSDDHWFDDHLERMADAIAATGGSAAFYFADTRPPAIEGGASWWDECGFSITEPHVFVRDATDWVLMDLQPTMMQSSVFHRDRYRAAGGLWPALRTRHDTHLFLVLGIGGPACAVAGGGVQMTADDRSGGRLTEAYGPATRDWWVQTELMYRDVLHRFPHLEARYRRRIKARLATAELRLGQDEWRRVRIGSVARHVARGFRVAPGHLTARAIRKLGRAAFGRDPAAPARLAKPEDSAKPNGESLARG